MQCLLRDHPFLKKLIRPSDFNQDDKMNVDAGKRLCQREVLSFISDPGLKQVLSLLRDFIDAFEDQNMSVQDKILKVVLSYSLTLYVLNFSYLFSYTNLCEDKHIKCQLCSMIRRE